MVKYNVAVIRGDGVGVEVVEEGLKVLHAVGCELDVTWGAAEFPWGSSYYFENGRMMPADALDRLAAFDVIYLRTIDSRRGNIACLITMCS